jgi:dCTP deaminase
VILTDREIQIALSNGQIIIHPPPSIDHAYSSTTVDLTLDELISVYRGDLSNDPIETIIDPGHPNYRAEETIAKLTNQVKIPPDGYVFRSGKLILGWTVERVGLPIHSRFAARVEGKSSLARLGLSVHVTAPTIHSGFNDKIRLEMVNHGAAPIRLRAGMRICQLIFEATLGTPQKGFQPMRSARTMRGSTAT